MERIVNSLFQANITRAGFTTRQEIARRVAELASSSVSETKKQKLLKELELQSFPKLATEERQKTLDAWVARLIVKAEKEGVLMTEAQFQDWNIGRRLSPGDYVRYIGPERIETVLDTEGFHVQVPRPHGQLGFIIQAEAEEDSPTAPRMLLFSPEKPVAPVHTSKPYDPMLVNLSVREYSRGWLTLERVR